MGEWRQPVSQPTSKGHTQNASSSIFLLTSDRLQTQLLQASDIQQAAIRKFMLTQEVALLLPPIVCQVIHFAAACYT